MLAWALNRLERPPAIKVAPVEPEYIEARTHYGNALPLGEAEDGKNPRKISELSDVINAAYEVGMVLHRGKAPPPKWHKGEPYDWSNIGAIYEQACEALDWTSGVRYGRCAKCGRPRPAKALTGASCVVCGEHAHNRTRQNVDVTKEGLATNDAHRLAQVGLACVGVAKPLETTDPLWSLEWQQARGLWNEKEEYRERYKQAITAAHKHDIPLERTSRTWEWKLVGQGEVLDFVNFVYRIRS